MTRKQERLTRRRTLKLRRDGYTLIEMLGMLSVLLVMALSAATLLARVTELGADTSQSRYGRMTVERLSAEFRRDVRSAERIVLTQQPASLELFGAEQVIRYSWTEASSVIHREVTSGGESLRFERFELPGSCRPACRVEEEVVSLRLSDPAQLRVWMIEEKTP